MQMVEQAKEWERGRITLISQLPWSACSEFICA